MVLKMATPYRHPQSGIFWLRRRVPADLVALIGRREEKISLRTREPTEAKAAYYQESSKLEARWANLRKGIRKISHKDAIGIAGEFYRELVAAHEDEPGDPVLVLGKLLIDQVAAGTPGIRVIASGNTELTTRMLDKLKNQNQASVERYLKGRGERVDADDLGRIMQAVNGAMVQGREQVLRYAAGDYRPDPHAGRFPDRVSTVSAAATDGQSADFFDLTSIYEKFAEEAKHAASSRKKWRAIISQVAAEVSDIRELTDFWVVGWKDRLVARGLSARSVQFGYLAALRSTCGWAVTNKRIARNPVDGIGIKVAKAKKERPKGYSDDEAKLVLRMTLKPMDGRHSHETKSARRWVPWLCSYTGARVGEIAQLRTQDIQQKDDVWMLWITPEAGTVKDGNSRFVAVHPHLIEQGFLDFVRSSRSGPLFYSDARKRGGTVENPTSKKVGERLAAWIREEGFTDKRVAPNHAWRHRFKTLSRRHKIDTGARDYMQGHAAASEGEEYGEFEPMVLYSEIRKLPSQIL